MIKEIFPEGQVIFKARPHTAEFFSQTIDEIDKSGESFIGLIRVDEQDSAYFLFFLKGDAYAAGCILNGKPIPLTIKNFLDHVSEPSKQRTITLYKTDPVLLKGMLVFLQREPSVKATSDMIHLKNVLSAIQDEKATAFVVLKKNNTHNFFFFLEGEAKTAHFIDNSEMQRGRSVIEQMLLYAYPVDKTPVEVMIFRDIKTMEANDISELKSTAAGTFLYEDKKDVKPSPAPAVSQPAKVEKLVRLRIEVTDGPQKGMKFNVPLPCTIGRRDADIRVRDMTISKCHASIESIGGKIIYKDLDSTNGSIINGKELKQAVLSDKDIIQIGNTTLLIHFITS
jgi:hypothetical protein